MATCLKELLGSLAQDDVYIHAVSVTCDGDLLEIQTEEEHKRTIK